MDLGTVLSYFELSETSGSYQHDILRIAAFFMLISYSTQCIIEMWTDSDRSVRSLRFGAYLRTLPPVSIFPIWQPYAPIVFFLFACISILLFPSLYAHGLHLGIATLGLLTGIFLLPEHQRLQLCYHDPKPSTRVDLFACVVLSLFAMFMSLWRWQNMPPGIDNDAALIGFAGENIWAVGEHPFYMNAANSPALFNLIAGSLIQATGDYSLGLLLESTIFGVLAVVSLYLLVRLFGDSRLSFWVAFALAITPYFQFYSREPMGTNLIFFQIVFLYGLIRSLMSSNWRWAIIAGVALGLAQWIYLASRALWVFLFGVLPLLWVYRKNFEFGWMKRLALLSVLGLLITISLSAMSNFEAQTWTWYLTPAGYTVTGSPAFHTIGGFQQRIIDHLNMWFDPTKSDFGAITVPGVTFLPAPLGALALFGLGLSFSMWRLFFPLFFLLAFACGLTPSFFGTVGAHGHRVILSVVPISILIGLAFSISFPIWRRALTLSKLSYLLAVSLPLIGLWSCLKYFHFTLSFKGEPSLEQYARSTERARAIAADTNTFDIRVLSELTSNERFLLGKSDYSVRPLLWNNWLPLNWEERPIAAYVREKSLFGFTADSFLSQSTEWHSKTDNLFFGWSYKTNEIMLTWPDVIKQWTEKKMVTGSIMLPGAGELEIICPGYRIEYQTGRSSFTAYEKGSFATIQGLSLLSFSAHKSASVPPLSFSLRFCPVVGECISRSLDILKLYRIPIHGWLMRYKDYDLESGALLETSSYQMVPALYGKSAVVNPFYEGRKRVFSYASVLTLPPGTHAVRLLMGGPPGEMCYGIKGLMSAPVCIATGHHDFQLEAPLVNNKEVEVVWSYNRSAHEHALETVSPSGEYWLPPYNWFTPSQFTMKR